MVKEELIKLRLLIMEMEEQKALALAASNYSVFFPVLLIFVLSQFFEKLTWFNGWIFCHNIPLREGDKVRMLGRQN